MNYKFSLVTSFLFLIFLFEIFFVQYLVAPFDKDSFLRLGLISDYISPISTHSFPIERRKTAPEIRKFTYNFFKVEWIIIEYFYSIPTVTVICSFVRNLFFIAVVYIGILYMKKLIFDYRTFIKIFIPRNHYFF